MDSSKLRKFAIESRLELIELVSRHREELDIGENELEVLACEWFIDILIFKFLEVNNYGLDKFRLFEEIKLHKDSGEPLTNKEIDRWILHMEIKYKNFRKIFPARLYKIDGLRNIGLLRDILDSKFIARLGDPNTIDEDKWKEVEIIGWLYQYYISDRNDKIIRAKRRYKKEEIPIVTQLFTPKWIVEYMVQNSLGRYILEHRPEYSRLKEKWGYYLDNPKIKEESESNFKQKELILEDIKCFDPAMGSGNILVYIMDFLYDFYILEGYEREEIPRIIIEKNLYGLEIDERVYKIAYFAIIMKAQEYNPNLIGDLLNDRIEPLKTNFIVIKETNRFTDEDIQNLSGRDSIFSKSVKEFIGQFIDSKILGSLTDVKYFNQEFYQRLKRAAGGSRYEDIIASLVHQSIIMNNKYDLTITNPPYIGSRYLHPKLHEFIGRKYRQVKSDIFSAFLIYCMKMTKLDGQMGFMTPYVWMFIASYENLRREIIENKSITSLVQLEYSAFSGATVPICSFTMRNYKSDMPGEYVKLSDFKGVKNQPIKTREAAADIDCSYRYLAKMDDFKNIPGYPIAYWANERIYEIYRQAKLLEDVASPRQGIATGNNDKYLRYWYEVDHEDIGFDYTSIEEFHESKKIYAPYNKGGKFRKWYGNFDYVIKFDEDSYKKLKKSGNKLPSKAYYFKEGITWSFVSSSYLGVRYTPAGRVFDVGGSSVFPEKDMIYYLTGLMCSKISSLLMNILNPTLNFQVGDIKNIPLIYDKRKKREIDELVEDNIRIAQIDWDSFEISWDFQTHPMLDPRIQICPKNSLEERLNNWKIYANKNFYEIKENEERLNEIFISIYGLEDYIHKMVEESDITISKIVKEKTGQDRLNPYIIDERQAIEGFLSYFIGSSLGRYSLDRTGIIRSKGRLNRQEYKAYQPAAYFNIRKSLISRLRKFLQVVLDKMDVGDDLEFIALKLNKLKKESPEERIERYFLKEFMEFHSNMYRKSPIYEIEEDIIRLKKL